MFEFRAATVCLIITEYFSSVRLRDWQVRGGALVDLVLLVLEKKTNTMSATRLLSGGLVNGQTNQCVL